MSEHTPGTLQVHPTSAEGQFSIDNDQDRLNAKGTWDERYVNFSGYFGSYGPHMFAAAPDMLAALKEALWALDNMAAILNAKGIESTLMDPRPGIRAAIAKAEGRS